MFRARPLEPRPLVTLRTLHVIDSMVPDAGSPAVSLPGLVRALKNRNVEATVFSSAGRWNDDDAGEDGSAELHELIGRADVVHIHGWDFSLAPKAASAARRAKKSYVLSPHGSLTDAYPRRKGLWPKLSAALSQRRAVRGAARLVALTDLEASALQDRGLDKSVTVLPYGLDFDRYAHPSPSGDAAAHADGRCLLMLGPIDPALGSVALLKAFAEIGGDADGWSVLVAGADTGDWRKMLEAAVRRKGGEDRVRFVQAPDVASQCGFLAEADALAAVSLRTSTGVSIMQAVASGVTVLASRYSAPDGLNGAVRVCEPQRDAIRDGLRAVLTLSDAQRAAIARDAREAGRKSYDWPVLVDRYLELYRGL